MRTVFLQIAFASDQDLQELRRHFDLMRASLREGATSLTPISMSLRKPYESVPAAPAQSPLDACSIHSLCRCRRLQTTPIVQQFDLPRYPLAIPQISRALNMLHSSAGRTNSSSMPALCRFYRRRRWTNFLAEDNIFNTEYNSNRSQYWQASCVWLFQFVGHVFGLVFFKLLLLKTLARAGEERKEEEEEKMRKDVRLLIPMAKSDCDRSSARRVSGRVGAHQKLLI